MCVIPFVRRTLSRGRSDLEPGDFVRRGGVGPVGIIESIDNGQATVAYDKDKREILPTGMFRRVKAGGHNLDKR
jgi:hypothetical protein